LQISRLKLSGFKSFVEPAELRIERGLTGVVGPNGCGKSNLLEAIRWVMGEGSAKSLRGGAMDDVIFAGTSTRPARNFAEVAILAHEVGTEGDAEVVRRIDRGAGSGYRINGNDVRAKDVGLLFADAATGAHSPALVSQGRISSIITSKPADRRAMLEEAAGISGLHVRRKDAEQKLRATETNLNRLDEVLTDMETRMGALRRQARSAEKYRKLSDEIKIAEGRLIFARWQTAAKAADAAKAEAAKAEQAVAEAGEQQRAVAAYQSQAFERQALARAATLTARDAATEASHALATLKADRDAMKRRIIEIAAQVERLAQDREREGALGEDAATALRDLTTEVKALEVQIAAAADDQPALVQRLNAAEAHVRDREVELAQALTEQAREQAETRVADAALQVAVKRLERAQQELAAYTSQHQSLGDDSTAARTREEAIATLSTARTEAKVHSSAILKAEALRQSAAHTREVTEAEVATACAALAALESEANALRKSIETGTTKHRALDQMTAASGFEHALAAALGDDLEAGIGSEGKRAWHGAVSTLNDPSLPTGGTALSQHVTAPAELGRRLAQIIVVDVDNGAPLAVGQRLVTKAGVLRRWDGYVATEQGGAAADRLIRVNRLSALKVQLSPAQEAVSQARTKLDMLRAEVDTARQQAESARAALAKAEFTIRTAQRAEDQANAQLERTAARRGDLAERMTQAKAEVEAASQEQLAATTARTAVPDGAATLQLVTKLNAAAEQARAAVADLRAALATHERDVAAKRERLSAAKSGIKNWQSRAGEAAKRIDDIAKRGQAMEAEAKQLEGAPERLEGKITNGETQLIALTAATETARAAELASEGVLRDIETKSAAIGEALATAREARAGAQARAENEELRRIEMGRVSGERFECPPPLLPQVAGFEAETIREAATESADLERLTLERERLGPVNLIAEQELAEIEETRVTSAAERDELAEAISRLRGSIGSLNREGRTRLMAAFEAVDGHFQRLFAQLFNGGVAHLELIDSDDPLEAGLEIFAQPPGKKLTSLSLLSGGEQALTAVALIFGLFLTNPAPICVLDEVDAPLDDANIERFCDLLDAMTRETNTRYLIVTHNAVTMARMHRLFGVTMVEQGVSRLVSVDLSAAERLVA
jgi:chromosome segregation protein